MVQCSDLVILTVAAQFPEDLPLMQVENADAHKARSLTFPDNAISIFLSPSCSKVNPIERVKRELKPDLAWVCLGDLC